MNTFKPGDKVRVTIRGNTFEGEYRGRIYDGAMHKVTFDAGTEMEWIGYFKTDRVVPVTPPCPWTESWTVVEYTRDEQKRRAYRAPGGTWFGLDATGKADWATDIAPFNPVRLVPEGSEKAEDTTPITGVHILHLAQTDLFKATCHCGQWSWARVTRERARDVHDLHLRNVGGVSS